jgi:hypothetical protein
MPSSSDILDGLRRIANEAFPLAVAWHAVVALVLVWSARGYRPPHRLERVLLATPLLSASSLALRFGNPFNAIVLGATAVVLLAASLRASGRRVEAGPRGFVMVGFATVAFAWIYPHFLVDQPAWAYLYGAPIGLVPSATLALVIGFALLSDGSEGNVSDAALAIVGIFYALFGALRLGVAVDLLLLVAAVVLLVRALALHEIAVVRPRSSRP